LARVGAYYHDIGKLKRPGYFTENQMNGVNVHEHTDPYVSAAIITAHTRDGVALAKAYRLPGAVQDIIAQHHGNTPVMYFYHKALQMAGGNPVNIENFRYAGSRPKTKEGAIVMLCDTIEAAVRTMKNPTMDGIEEFIVKLVRGKLEDGQLNDCPLTLRDIDRICAAATQVLAACSTSASNTRIWTISNSAPPAPPRPIWRWRKPISMRKTRLPLWSRKRARRPPWN
jgi:putative nucleotidyltransferase with HDIG domain